MEETIWSEFCKRHSNEEILTTIAAVLAERMPEHTELLSAAIRTAAVPVQTPFPPPSHCMRQPSLATTLSASAATTTINAHPSSTVHVLTNNLTDIDIKPPESKAGKELTPTSWSMGSMRHTLTRYIRGLARIGELHLFLRPRITLKQKVHEEVKVAVCITPQCALAAVMQTGTGTSYPESPKTVAIDVAVTTPATTPTIARKTAMKWRSARVASTKRIQPCMYTSNIDDN